MLNLTHMESTYHRIVNKWWTIHNQISQMERMVDEEEG